MARKKNVLYGNHYKACPCAQIVQKDSIYNADLIEAICYSPSRTFPGKISGKDYDQVRICCGGTARGKRYTSCPYYVKNAKTEQNSVVRKITPGGLIKYLIVPLVLGYTAIQFFKQGESSSTGAGIFFGALAIFFLSPIFKSEPQDYVQGHKKRGTRKK